MRSSGSHYDSKFYRSNHGKVAGICEAMGDSWDIDPLVFRVIFTVLCLFTPLPAGFVYLLIWFLTAKNPQPHM